LSFSVACNRLNQTIEDNGNIDLCEIYGFGEGFMTFIGLAWFSSFEFDPTEIRVLF
jgi:hypothetical protein